MLIGIPIVDSASRRLYEYLKLGVHELDRAAGEHFELLLVGDPEQGGAEHRRLRSPQMAVEDSRAAEQWVQAIHQTGREDSHRLREMQSGVELFGLSQDDIPCFVFLTQGGPPEPVGVLRIPPHWYESDTAWSAFKTGFVTWLKRADVKGLCTSKVGEEDIRTGLVPLLGDLTLAVEDDLKRAERPSRKVRPPLIRVPRGCAWKDIQITVVSEDSVVVDVAGSNHRLTYRKLGLMDRRTKKPSQQWIFLEMLAAAKGTLVWEDSAAVKENGKRRQRLGRTLREVFGLREDPFVSLPDSRGWRAQFRIGQRASDMSLDGRKKSSSARRFSGSR